MSDEGYDADDRFALRIAPMAKHIMDTVKPMLPDGTHFGVFILVPNGDEIRVVAATTDRDVVCPPVAAWVLQTLRHGESR